ncbi:MAG: putative Ig domain-containing protein [Pyrinomonadaceae bacterium]
MKKLTPIAAIILFLSLIIIPGSRAENSAGTGGGTTPVDSLTPEFGKSANRRKRELTKYALAELFTPAPIVVFPRRVIGRRFVVENTDDSGAGSLRQAILDANNLPGHDEIIFRIPSFLGKQISPESELPTITDRVNIFTSPSEEIELNGTQAGRANGLIIEASFSEVQGLVINRFRRNGILIRNGGRIGIAHMKIGTDPTGQLSKKNGKAGISIERSSGLNGISHNLISGNTEEGIFISRSSGNFVCDNKIGTDITGFIELGNMRGIVISRGDDNKIAPGFFCTGNNTISGNRLAGISIESGSMNNLLISNKIGTDLDGRQSLPNLIGVEIIDSSNNSIGPSSLSPDPDSGNLISGNTTDGIIVDGRRATNNRIQDNLIGVKNGSNPNLPNGGAGVNIKSGASENDVFWNTISGNIGNGVILDDDADRNRIIENGIGTRRGQGFASSDTPNRLNGLNINSADNIIRQNDIGSNLRDGIFIVRSRGNRFGRNIVDNNVIALNHRNGITIDQSGNNLIRAFNVISGNSGHGVELVGGSRTKGNQVGNNRIGTNPDGSFPVPNGAAGIRVEARDTLIAENTVAFNGTSGIIIVGSNSDGNLIQKNSIFSNTALGIDLGDDGVSLNDITDPDHDANETQNFPVPLLATSSTAGTNITWRFNSRPRRTFVLEFFVNPECDQPSNNGEGKSFLGSTVVRTDNNGDALVTSVAFSQDVEAGAVITATATDDGTLDTSEFSPCVAVVRVGDPTPDPTPVITNPDGQINTVGDTVTPLQITVTPDTSTVVVTGLPGALSFNPANNTITGTVGDVLAGPYTVTITATNGASSASVNFIWTILPLVITNPGDKTNTEGETVTPVQITVTPATSVVQVTDLPGGLLFNPANNTIAGTVADDAVGTYMVMITATNGSATANASFVWTIVEPPGSTVSGTVFLEDGTTPVGAGLTVRVLVDGVNAGTAATNSSGQYQINGVPLDFADSMMAFVDDANIRTAAATAANPFPDGIPDLDLTANTLTVRSDAAVPNTNALIAAAKGSSTDPDIPFDVTNGKLTVDEEIDLLIRLDTNYSPGGDVEVAADWITLGNFQPGTFTVKFAGAGEQTIEGDTQWFDLEVIANDERTLFFEAGNTQTVFGNLTFRGADADNKLALRSATPGQQWQIVLPSTATADVIFVDVQDSDASGGQQITATDSTDSGNNFDWIFQVTPVITNPGPQTAIVGANVSLPITIEPQSGIITIQITGIPPGLGIETNPFRIAGVPTTAGQHTVTITATSGTLSDSESFEWTIIAPPDEVPVIINPGNQSSAEGDTVAPVQITVTPATSVVTVTGLPGELSYSATETITGTVAAGQAGDHTVTITAVNGSETATATFVWEILPADEVPVITAVPDQTNNEGDDVSVPLLFTPEESDIQVTGLPGGITYNAATKKITGVVWAGSEDIYDVDVVATNGDAMASRSFRWTITVPPGALYVTNTNNSGAGSLPEAINFATSLPGANKIFFIIPGVGPFRIQPLTALSMNDSETTMDARTQPGFVGTPIVEIDGSSLPPSAVILNVNTIDHVVVGFSFTKGGNNAITVRGTGHDLLQNWIGIDTDSTPAGNGGSGIFIFGGVGLTIASNEIANNFNGIVMQNANDPTRRTTIRDNILSDHLGEGFRSSNSIRYDFVENFLWRNGNGVSVTNVLNCDCLFEGNYFGTDKTKTQNFANFGAGLGFSNAGNVLVRENKFGFNGVGVPIQNSSALIKLIGNEFFSHTSLAIDHDNNGVTQNDSPDVDGVPNFPVIVAQSGSLVTGTLNSTPDETFTVEFFESSTAHLSGFGEGTMSIGTVQVTTDANGNAVLNFVPQFPVPPSYFVTATATSTGAGSTSEFSQATQVPAPLLTAFILENFVAEIELQDLQGTTENLTMTGDLAGNLFTSASGEAADHDGDGLDEIFGRIVDVDASAQSGLFGLLTLGIRQEGDHPFQRSIVKIEETTNDQPGTLEVGGVVASGTANVEMKVYIQAAGQGGTFHTDGPVTLLGQTTQLPPPQGTEFNAVDITGLIAVVNELEIGVASSKGTSSACSIGRFDHLGGNASQRIAALLVIWLPVVAIGLLRRRAKRRRVAS